MVTWITLSIIGLSLVGIAGIWVVIWLNDPAAFEDEDDHLWD